MGVSRERRSLSTSIKVEGRKPVTNIETETLIRSMYQADIKKDAPTALSYEFHFGISTFTHDGAGVVYTEIPRPLNLPLVDATSQKLERCSFEFLIAVPYDSVDKPVDSHMSILQDFAYDARPVNFLNVHSALALKTWNIDSMSFQVTRVNRSGKATAVTCNMSLVEYIARTNERFYGLPKFSYAVPKGTGLAGTTGDGTGNDSTSVTGNVITIIGNIDGTVTITTSTNHGLKNGVKVKINMSPDLPSNILGLRDVNLVYEIFEVTTTTFKYRHTKRSLYTPFTNLYSVVLPKIITYSTTSDAASPFVFKTSVTNYVPYVPNTTTGPTDDTIVLDTTASAKADAEIAKKYLYKLKARSPVDFVSYIGTDDSTGFKSAVSYLVQIYSSGQDITTLSIKDIAKGTPS